MRIKLVKSLRGGETLAEPVITEEKEILIKKGTILKPEYLDLISFLGIDTVCIEDPYLSYENPHQLIESEKLQDYIQKVKKILETHIYNGKENLKMIDSLAEEIIRSLEEIEDDYVIDLAVRSADLYEHTIMVTLLSLIIAKRLKLSEEQMLDLAVAGLFHDLGLRYITVPFDNYEIETVSASEQNEFKKHPVLGFSALENESWINYNVKKMVLSHHERRDGSGFPLKQKIKEAECSILQVCDAFDCLISGMECKRVSVQAALEYLDETADILFDKRMVKLLEKIIARYPVGTKVRLNTGENGIVALQTNHSAHPVVSVLNKDDSISDIQYNLNTSRKITILQILD